MHIDYLKLIKDCVQYFLGRLSRPDGCNRLSVINYRPSDVIFTLPLVYAILLADGVQEIQGMWQRQVTEIINWWQFDSFLSCLECRLQKFIARDRYESV